MAARRHGKWRVEAGLDRDLHLRGDISAAERAALRAQAHAVDLAEHDCDADRLSRANAVYLDLRRAAGLTANAAAQPQSDPFDAFLRDLAKPEPAPRDSAD